MHYWHLGWIINKEKRLGLLSQIQFQTFHDFFSKAMALEKKKNQHGRDHVQNTSFSLDWWSVSRLRRRAWLTRWPLPWVQHALHLPPPPSFPISPSRPFSCFLFISSLCYRSIYWLPLSFFSVISVSDDEWSSGQYFSYSFCHFERFISCRLPSDALYILQS